MVFLILCVIRRDSMKRQKKTRTKPCVMMITYHENVLTQEVAVTALMLYSCLKHGYIAFLPLIILKHIHDNPYTHNSTNKVRMMFL